ncbi:MAG TPA: hypothetical protein PK133_10490, partial [Ferruginibacter sp.]|nr:hypothetical protein [Ferruginibacter sp.]
MAKKIMYKECLLYVLLLASVPCLAQKKAIERRVDSVLKLMTLEEKIGQLNQYNDDWTATGPVT